MKMFNNLASLRLTDGIWLQCFVHSQCNSDIKVIVDEIRLQSPHLLPLNPTACARMLCVRAAALDGGEGCRWWSWLLKYNIYEILHRKER